MYSIAIPNKCSFSILSFQKKIKCRHKLLHRCDDNGYAVSFDKKEKPNFFEFDIFSTCCSVARSLFLVQYYIFSNFCFFLNNSCLFKSQWRFLFHHLMVRVQEKLISKVMAIVSFVFLIAVTMLKGI